MGTGYLFLKSKAQKLLALMILSIALPAAYTAEIYTEHFLSGAAQWTNSGSMGMSWSSSALVGSFGQQGFPFPEFGAFIATNISSGGRFTGNYNNAGITLIGFSFKADNVLPSDLLLRWQGNGVKCFRGLRSLMANPDTWYRFYVSLKSRSAGRWVGATSDQQFTEGLADVEKVEVSITRNGDNAQTYRLTDFFVDQLPSGDLIEISNGTANMSWSELRTGVEYTVESTASIMSNWNGVATVFVATSSVEQVSTATSSNANMQFYRITFPEAMVAP